MAKLYVFSGKSLELRILSKKYFEKKNEKLVFLFSMEYGNRYESLELNGRKSIQKQLEEKVSIHRDFLYKINAPK